MEIMQKEAIPTLDLIDVEGRNWPVHIVARSEKVLEGSDGYEATALEVLDVHGPAGLPVPGRYMLEQSDGEMVELELVYHLPLGGERAFYLAALAVLPELTPDD